MGAGLTADLSSQFDKGTALGLFPSVNLAYRVAGDNLPQEGVVDDWKVRVGISEAGNDNVGVFTSRQYYMAEAYKNASGLVKANLANEDLRWETTRTINVGTDINLLKERVKLVVDYFVAKTSNVLLFEPTAVIFGGGGNWKNLATTGTRGFEIAANVLVVNGEKFKWNIAANIAKSKSTVLSLPNGAPIITDITGGQMITQEGFPLYQFYGYNAYGVYASTTDVPAGLKTADGKLYQAGDMIYEDVVKDGIIDSKDRQILGSAEPDWYGGFQTSFSYKGISLSAAFDFKMGNEIFNYARMKTEGMTDLNNQTLAVSNRWTIDGQQTNVPRISVNMPENAAFSSRWIEDGSYLRLKSVNLSYHLAIKDRMIKGFKIFCQADNLLTMSKYLGSHPDVGYGKNAIYQGVDYFKQPQSPSVIMGVKLEL